MKIWLITDTHFGHEKMIDFGRPKGFEQKILKNMASQLLVIDNKTDMIIHLGDFSLGKDEFWNTVFNTHFPGIKWLVRGNHDHKSSSWYLSRGWSFVGDMVVFKAFGKSILFSHEPTPRSSFWNVDINIHGHFHNNQHRLKEAAGFYDPTYHKLLSLEKENYKLIELKSFIEKYA